MDDAGYYIAQQKEEVQFNQAYGYGAFNCNEKFFLCWVDGVKYEKEIGGWESRSKLLEIFSKFHSKGQIDSDYFLARSIPIEDDDDDDDWDDESEYLPKIDNLKCI
ncbi:hypothetical protein [Nitrosomonas sp. Nm58]|uniref:hypothetical protein n=1 Tax=Nitrosomonas sp. Nm58 TaxID=200126 RepID=UPI000897E12D|nr:hypothetical protein [Nitrosomonas sp. Nm58]SDY81970.1 hypothetical protein SAMN05421754_10242 [Nitrosomonas sp. Nm58]